MWDGIAPKLARDHQVILVQVNGFAGDDPGANLEPGVLAGIVKDLHSYIASHRLGRRARHRSFDGRPCDPDVRQGPS